MPSLRFRSLPATLLALSTLAPACALLRNPDMTQPAGITRHRKPGHPLILIHGFLGSRLRDPRTHRVAWGTMANILRGAGRGELALPIDGEDEEGSARLEAYEIYDGLWGVEFYSRIIDSLATAGGYRFGDIDAPAPGDNAFIFVYDWRRDLAESALQLSRAIETLKAKLGRSDLTFDLMAHSQGGLIARYYVMFGGADVLASDLLPADAPSGAAHVNKVIMLGTPNRGCLESLKILHLGVKRVFRPMPPEVVFTMPALFQMLPPPGAVSFADVAGNPLPLDLYDPATWEREEWSAFSPETQARLMRELGEAGRARRNGALRRHLDRSLARAARLHRALAAPLPSSAVAYHAFGSDCVSTLKTAVLLPRPGRKGGAREIHFDPRGLREKGGLEGAAGVLYGPGDGTVLMESLLALPEAAGAVDFESAFFVCEKHGYLPTNPIFQNNLLYLLLRQSGVETEGAGPAPAVSARGGP